MNPWSLELLVVRSSSHLAAERRSVARDVERGLLIRLRRGVYVERTAFIGLGPEAQHIVRMRAVEAVAPAPVRFSHVSAAVGRGLPSRHSHLGRVHATFANSDLRGRSGVAGHVLPLTDGETSTVHGLVLTTVARTVVDLAGALPFEEGVTVADAALRAGTPRDVLEAAIEIAGPRKASRRIRDVIRFGHAGGEGANESYSRVRFMRMGFWPPELQHPLWDEDGFVAWLDFWFTRFRVGGEADGKVKLLDPAMAKEGAGKALWNEKRREDRVLPLVDGLARWGWAESNSSPLLRRKVEAFGVVPADPPATLADYAAAARNSRPRPFLLPS